MPQDPHLAPRPGPLSWPSKATLHRTACAPGRQPPRRPDLGSGLQPGQPGHAAGTEPHPGRAPILPRAEEGRFLERLDAPPRPEDGSVPSGGPTSAASWRRNSASPLRRQAVYDLLHRLDYSSLMPRPQHEQANPEVQEFFKEIVVEQIDAIAGSASREGGSYLFSG